MVAMGLEQEIKDKGRELGFDAVGISDASPISREHVEHLDQWLRQGYAGPMEYMHRNIEKRIDPAQLRKGAQSVVIVALGYKTGEPPSSRASFRGPAPAVGWALPTILSDAAGAVGRAHPTESQSEISNPKSAMAKVAAYAQYEDYHPFMKSLLRELASFLSVRAGRPDRYKICVDSAPLAEKALAVRAGLGFIGKNHLLTHPQLGPQVLLGGLVTTIALQPDEPNTDTCQRCDRCIKACPTGALGPDGFLDAGRCISCLTQYPSQEEPTPDTHGWLFGCDECLQACPFHEQAPPCANHQFKFHPDRASLDPHEVLTWDARTFDARLADSPVHRLGLARLQQTAQACLART
jgi:epoxyqueuosine reductase